MTETTQPQSPSPTDPHALDRVIAWLEPWGENTPHRAAADAIKALRSEIDRLRSDRPFIVGFNEGYESALSTADAEPVAWRWKFDADAEWSYGDNRPVGFRFGDPDFVEPLYAAPPAVALKTLWHPIEEADKSIAYIHDIGAGFRIGNSYPMSIGVVTGPLIGSQKGPLPLVA